MTDRIVLTNLRFEARHGVHDWEREVPQPFEVDVELALDLLPAGDADDLALTIDYGPVYRIVAGVLDGPSIQLLEAIAERDQPPAPRDLPDRAGSRGPRPQAGRPAGRSPRPCSGRDHPPALNPVHT